jgi:hypothetical protein
VIDAMFRQTKDGSTKPFKNLQAPGKYLLQIMIWEE